MIRRLKQKLILANIRYWLYQTILMPLLAFGVIYSVSLITAKLCPFPQSPVLICSMGASAVIFFTTPGSPFASSWSFIGGHLFSALIGISCAIGIPDICLAAASAVGGAMLTMQLLRCMNPPGAATALAPIISTNNPNLFDYYYFFTALLINIIAMLIFSLAIKGFRK